MPHYLTEKEIERWSDLEASFELLKTDPTAAKEKFDNLNNDLGKRSYISMYGSAMALEKLIEVDPKQERNAIQAFRVLVNFGKKLPKEIMKPSLQRYL